MAHRLNWLVTHPFDWTKIRQWWLLHIKDTPKGRAKSRGKYDPTHPVFSEPPARSAGMKYYGVAMGGYKYEIQYPARQALAARVQNLES